MWNIGASIAACRSQPEDRVGEEELERPLVLLVAAGRAERHHGPVLAQRQRRRQRRARPPPGRPATRAARPRARTSARACRGRTRGRGSPGELCSQPPLGVAETRLPEAVGDVEVAGVAARRLAHAGGGRRAPRPDRRQPPAEPRAAARPTPRHPPARAARRRTRARAAASSGTGAESPYHASRSANASFAHSTTRWTCSTPRNGAELEPVEQRELLQEHRPLAPRPGLEHRPAAEVERDRRLERGRERGQVVAASTPACASPELSTPGPAPPRRSPRPPTRGTRRRARRRCAPRARRRRERASRS